MACSLTSEKNICLSNILEQDHRAIKRRVRAKQGFREFHAARRVSGSDVRRQIQFINELFGVAA